MPKFNQTFPIPNPASQAKLKQVKMQAANETAQKNMLLPIMIFQNVALRPRYRELRPNEIYLEGDLLCPNTDVRDNKCLSKLIIGENKLDISCKACGYKSTLSTTYDEFYNIALEACRGQIRWIESGGKIQTLDVPYDAIKANHSTDNRDIKIKWSQRHGRDTAVIYFINKSGNDDGEKSHVFVDMDREEIRRDLSDLPPGHIIARVEVIFKSNKTAITYKQ